MIQCLDEVTETRVHRAGGTSALGERPPPRVVAGLAFSLLRRLVAVPWGGRARPARWAGPSALAIAVAFTLMTGAQLATCAR